METDIHPAKVEQQIAELAAGELMTMAEGVSGQSSKIDPSELGEMYMHVELDNDLRWLLGHSARHPDRDLR